MPKRSWNTFISANPNATLLGAAVSARLPATLTFDKSGKKLPTPYGLFQEWLASLLVGEWSATPVKGGFVFGVTSAADQAAVLKKYGPTRPSAFTLAKRSVPLTIYQDSSYQKLATQLGYSL